ncbi:MAG: thioredoxin domain-containing protein [Nitrospirae bacterium]|nr:thioredoxin domain-containing protein [Nitrospirota bacterium]
MAIPWFVIVLALTIGGCATPAVKSDTKADVAAVLKEHPELILEALKDQETQLLQLVEAGSQKRERLAKENQRLAELKNPFQPDLSTPRPVRGQASAPITIVEYADFECPFCAQAHQTVKHDRLYEAPDLLKQGEAGMESVVASLGLDAERLRRDLAGDDITTQIQRDRDEAMRFGFQGTPAFLLNGVSLRGAYPLDEFVQVIELVRSNGAQRSKD